MEVPDEHTEQSANEQETSTEVQPTRESWIKRRWAWMVLLGLGVAVLAIIGIITMRADPGGRAGGDEAIDRTASDHSPGSEVRLYLQGRDSIMVAVDEKTLDELISVISSQGAEVQNLIQSGRVFTVPNRTRVRIVEEGFAKLKVRIIEGEKIMLEGWVPERWVR